MINLLTILKDSKHRGILDAIDQEKKRLETEKDRIESNWLFIKQEGTYLIEIAAITEEHKGLIVNSLYSRGYSYAFYTVAKCKEIKIILDKLAEKYNLVMATIKEIEHEE